MVYYYDDVPYVWECGRPTVRLEFKVCYGHNITTVEDSTNLYTTILY